MASQPLQRSYTPPSTPSTISETDAIAEPPIYMMESQSTKLPSSNSAERSEQSMVAASQSASPLNGEPRKCWICLNDETDDPSAFSDWRTPCPCVLTAHESCLLEWFAHIQAPNLLQGGSLNSKYFCPQCKSEIIVARPRSIFVDTINQLVRAVSWAVLPGLAFITVGSAWHSCFTYGARTVYTIFGKTDGDVVMGHAIASKLISSTYESFWPTLPGKELGLRLSIGLPLIPFVLISSRTSPGARLLPYVPLIFFATRTEYNRLDRQSWPPSAATSIAILPFIRLAYHKVYQHIVGGLEKKWLREIKPRADESVEPEGEDTAEIVIQIGLNLDEEDEDLNEEEAPAINPEGEAAAEAAEPAAVEAAEPVRVPQLFPRRRLVSTIVGALLFPSISAAMGDLLKLALPNSWTTSQSRRMLFFGRGTDGVLSEKWARSLIGGCLFVVLKDAVFLYYRWQIMQSFRKRRVLDYKGSKVRALIDRV
ncbi:MAG: hypothetical protein M1829_003248 [Trizodia sp. TS-e1964]|nr:MAG: hypothetical protein M1829_003248 [Trizodia sp. TS-e1964]